MTKPSKAALLAISVVVFVMGFHGSTAARTLLNANISTGGIYTDNLFFSETDKTDSFGVTVGPQVNINYTSPDLILGLTYSGIGQIFPDETGANRYIQNASTFIDLPFLTKRIKGLEVRLIENITFTPSLDGFGEIDQTGVTLSNPGGQNTAVNNTGLSGVGGNTSGVPGVGNQGIQIQRTNALRNLAGFQLRYLASRRVTLTGSYRNLLTIFTEDGFRNSSINTMNAGAIYDFYASPTTTGNLNYAFTPIISDISNPIFRHRIGIGGNHLFTPSISLNGTVGVTIIQEDPAQAFANVSLSKLFEQGSIVISYGQGTGLAQGFANSATLSQFGAITASHALTERINGFLQLNAARNNSLSGNDIDLLSYGGSAGLTIGLLQWLSAGVNYNYFKQENQGGNFGVNADRNFVTLFLTAFADPIKLTE